MPTQPLDIPGPDGTIDCTFHTPADGGRWPGVLMLTDIKGTRPEFKQMADRLAGEGYAVLLPNVYYRQGRAPVPDLDAPMNAEGLKALFPLMQSLTPERMRADAAAELDALAARPEVKEGPLGVVGYCMSGPFAVYAAQVGGEKVAASAGYHGARLIRDDPDSPHRIAASVPAALYFGHADHDETIPEARLPELEETLRAAGKDFASEVYEGAVHGFAVPGPRYDAAASERHWKTLLALFGRTLG